MEASYLIGPWIFRELGVEVIKTAVDPDGFNINNGCGALHPETISRLVQQHGADAGIAFDGDADRVVFCDSRGGRCGWGLDTGHVCPGLQAARLPGQ